MIATPRPLPKPDDVTRAFWDAANEHVLVAQRCGACRAYQHPPQARCGACGSTDLAFVRLSGRGTVYTYTVVHDTRVQGLKPYQPFAIIAVQLEESPDLLMVSDLIGAGTAAPEIGDQVEVEFHELAPGRTVPQFRKRTAGR
jgi:uncharacterized OB-fold protein